MHNCVRNPMPIDCPVNPKKQISVKLKDVVQQKGEKCLQKRHMQSKLGHKRISTPTILNERGWIYVS